MFGFEHDGVVGLRRVSKTLGGGLPPAATITSARSSRTATRRASSTSPPVSDPLPAAAGLAVLDVIAEEDLVGRAAARGEYMLAHLRELQARHESIGDVRGRGLLIGLELVEDPEAADRPTHSARR